MRILVTAGPTREYFDSVRFVSNASSGRMGYAIAANAAGRGLEVVLISGPVELPSPEGVDVVRVVSAAEMLDAAVGRFSKCQVAVMAAAVCDEKPACRCEFKPSKPSEPRAIEFVPTVDICERLGRTKDGRVVIGFAMEDHDSRRHAEQKLKRKHCDAMVMNSPDALGADSAKIEVFRPDLGWSSPILGSKTELARAIVDLAIVLCPVLG